jgi:class 3 adenylate cyclase
VAQTRVAASEMIDLDVALSPGVYRLRSPQLPWSVDLRVEAEGVCRRWEFDLAGGRPPPPPALAPGGQVLTLANARKHEVLVRLERTAGRDDALTAAQASALPTFRELFGGEVLSPGQLARASAVTLLWTQLDGGATLYDRLGEAPGFQLLQATLRIVEDRVRAEGGAVVKTVDEGLLAVFRESAAAVRAALSLKSALAAGPDTSEVQLQVAVHRGLTMMATVNERLDYFGPTVKQTARLLAEAPAGEVLLAAALATDPEVEPVLRGREIELADLPRPDGGRVLVYRVRP